jgi:hypothetical protein
MLERVQAEDPAALMINESEVREFLDGRSRKVKPGSSNPFKNTDIAEQTADLDTAGSSTAASSANPFQSFSF